jgi:hypothetical protein
LHKSKQDLFLVAIAEGPAIHSPFWPIAKPFQHVSGELRPLVIGSTGAVWIDADGDGRRTSAYEYAKAMWNSSNGDIHALIKKLRSYDESVAVQAAAILTENSMSVEAPEVTRALLKATAETKNGFRHFIKDLETSRVQ